MRLRYFGQWLSQLPFLAPVPRASKGYGRPHKRLRFSSPRWSRPSFKLRGFSDSRKRLGQGFKELFSFKGSFAYNLCLILGLVSIVGFLIDVTAIALPLQPFEVTWRLEVIRAVADRSLVLLFGLGLLAFPLKDNYFLKRPFSRLYLLLGVIGLLLCILVFQSVHTLRETAKISIEQQRSQALGEIQAFQATPQTEAPALTPEQIANATAQISQQADMAQQNAFRDLYRTLFIVTGNLIVVSVGSISLSRLLSADAD